MSDETQLTLFNADNSFFTGGGQMFPRLQLITNRSEIVESRPELTNKWCLVTGDSYDVLGENVDLEVLASRSTAIDFKANVFVFDRNDARFDEIAARSDQKNSGCGFGPEYLVYLPSAACFATFFCSSKSARIGAANIQALLRTKKVQMTFGSKLVPAKGDRPAFRTYTVRECSVPFGCPDTSATVKLFMEQKSTTEAELAPDSNGSDR